MRYLLGEELEQALWYGENAAFVASRSPCQKSKRGVVIVKNDAIIGKGYNELPEDFACDDACKLHCRDFAVHAEMNAMFDTLQKGHSLNGARAYHMKAVDGVNVPKGTPSCVPCSKHMLAFGLSEIVLLDERGFALYDVEEFHTLSLQNNGYEFKKS